MLKKLKGLLRRDPEQFRIPRSVQEVIPIRTVWKSGIFLVGSNRYSRTWQFSDINYALAGEEDQKSMLLGYCHITVLLRGNRPFPGKIFPCAVLQPVPVFYPANI